MVETRETPGDTTWFVHDRFGMFIHWGLYALPARHEWVKMREEMDDETYNVYFRHFDPDLYDPVLWAKAAANAGMKYFVVTTKHHEGFCLWDSALTDYKATNTPHGKDLLKPMVDAFRTEGLRVGFYHSLIDWRHPHYDIDGVHPLRNRPDIAELNKDRDIADYREYLHGQTRELLTRFGPVDILWYDFSYSRHSENPEWQEKGWRGKGRKDWHSEELIELVRELQPNILLNDRLEIDQDIKTPEQVQPREWVKVDGVPVVWEACHTFSGSWGYHRDEMTWKSPEQLVQLLINSVSLGGNLLMNVGPTGRGEFDARARRAGGLRRVDEAPRAEHLRLHAERVDRAGRLPLHAERQAAVSARLRLALQAHPPRRSGRQSGVRPTAARRLGGALYGGERGGGQEPHLHHRQAQGVHHPRTARSQAQRHRARRRVVPQIGRAEKPGLVQQHFSFHLLWVATRQILHAPPAMGSLTCRGGRLELV